MLRLSALAVLGATGLAACGHEDDDRPTGGGSGNETDGPLALVAADVARSAGDPAAVPAAVRGMQVLGGELYGAFASGSDNLVLSPYSVAVALGMTLAGAAGRTATEMQDVLGADASYHDGLAALTAHVDGLAGPQERGDGSKAELTLATANQLFGQRDVGWSGDFLDVLARDYGTGVRTVDFATAYEEARGLINDWVAEQTHDKILDLVPPGVLDAMTRLVLVNAVYLAAPWERPFEKSLTSSKPFHTLDGGTVQAHMMRSSEAAATRARGDGWTAARLPYAGQRLAMTVVLPDEDRFADVERAVSSGGLGDLLSGGEPTILDLELPRWTFRTVAPLSDALKALGMPTAFDPDRADFTPMTDEDLPLVIQAVLHQGYIAVDEDGTEAAAATAVVNGTTAMPVTEEFHVDRPFLFAIHDVDHGAPLFLGRVTDPTA